MIKKIKRDEYKNIAKIFVLIDRYSWLPGLIQPDTKFFNKLKDYTHALKFWIDILILLRGDFFPVVFASLLYFVLLGV